MAASTVISRLRHGVPSADHGPAFDRASFPVYVALLLTAMTTATATVMLGFSVDPPLFLHVAWAPWLWLGGVLVKRVGHPRIGGACEAIGLLYLSGFAFLLLITVITALAAPFADRMLVASDKLIGFDWRRLAAAIEPHQRALSYLTAAYRSFAWQPALVLALLFAQSRGDKAWPFVLAWMITLAIAAALYPFVPAEGPMRFYHVAQARFPGLLGDSAWRFGPIIQAVRDGGVRHLTASTMTGLVSFPSFHVAGAALLAWAAWPIRLLGLPLVLLNAVMAFAAILCGPHYLVDVIAGLAIAAIAIGVADKIVAASASPEPGRSGAPGRSFVLYR